MTAVLTTTTVATAATAATSTPLTITDATTTAKAAAAEILERHVLANTDDDDVSSSSLLSSSSSSFGDVYEAAVYCNLSAYYLEDDDNNDVNNATFTLPTRRRGKRQQFARWAGPILRETMHRVIKQEKFVAFYNASPTSSSTKAMTTSEIAVETTERNDNNDNNMTRVLMDMKHEFVLQLLELYETQVLAVGVVVVGDAAGGTMPNSTTAHNNRSDSSSSACDYADYRPTVGYGRTASAGEDGIESAKRRLRNAQRRNAPPVPRAAATRPIRTCFVIVAFKDVEQLERLVDAVWLEENYVVVHLERRTSQEYRQQVERRILSKYNHDNSDNNDDKIKAGNVVVLQFGSVVYPSDSVSGVTYKIMNWLHDDVGLEYDYLALLDGASFPLLSARAMQAALPDRDVYLGELLHGQRRVRKSQQHWVTEKHRLVYTNGDGLKIQTPALKNFVGGRTGDRLFSDELQKSFRYKSASGNHGIFSRKVVSDLISNIDVRQLFAVAKYACCCCTEERTWIAALHRIGYGRQALESYGMFYLWGCPGMKNLVLDDSPATPNSCYSNDLAYDVDLRRGQRLYRVQLWDRMVEAQQEFLVGSTGLGRAAGENQGTALADGGSQIGNQRLIEAATDGRPTTAQV